MDNTAQGAQPAAKIEYRARIRVKGYTWTRFYLQVREPSRGRWTNLTTSPIVANDQVFRDLVERLGMTTEPDLGKGGK